jgi:phenylacetate-CoA ligase
MTAKKAASMDQRVRDIVKHAYDKSPASKKRLDDAGLTPKDIQSVDDLGKIPVFTKDELVELQASDPPFGGMLTVPISELKWIFFSPGPLYEGVSDDEAAVEQMAGLLGELGFEASDVVLNSMSYHLVPFGVQFDAAVRELGGTVLPTGVGNTDLQVKMLLDHRATAFIGTPSFLMTLIQKAEEFGVDFKTQSNIKKAIVTAEPLPPSLREALEGYGIRLMNLYGTAELGLLGYEAEGGKGFKIPDRAILQICDPASGELLPDGEVGEIVGTNFNTAYPLIRLGTGDLSKIDPSSGHMMGWMGRSGDAIKVRGMFLHPNQLGQVMGRFSEVARYQAVITRPAQRDEFTLRVELADPSADQDALAAALTEAIPPVCRVKPDSVDFIPPGTIPEDAKQVVDERTWE